MLESLSSGEDAHLVYLLNVMSEELSVDIVIAAYDLHDFMIRSDAHAVMLRSLVRDMSSKKAESKQTHAFRTITTGTSSCREL